MALSCVDGSFYARVNLSDCNDPAESAQFKPLMYMPERVFSWQALGEVACGCRS